jgi:HD-GYP domain-containing protein (c-di-GMP phosphodiesterase class II)/GAF domain-containing protein
MAKVAIGLERRETDIVHKTVSGDWPDRRMTDLVQKLTGVRDLKKILETTVKELGDTFSADACQIMLSNPLDANITSICEFKVAGDPEDFVGLPSVTVPLMLHGRMLGSFSLSRRREIVQEEVNIIRVILGELSDIIRHAQINDVVQRDTFRETFLVEIGNVMAYSLGFGDALFMVVNILGKVLGTSRCLFICTDDNQAGWKCFEFWQQEKVQSCTDYRWPTTDSPVIAQTLLSTVPLRFYEGQENSYVSPVQEELQFIGVKSLLGVALRSDEATHGCVILQQCDYRRAWTRGEIDMVQNVADKVAEALVKLAPEKRAREPIMQLHQRIVTPPTNAVAQDAFSKIENVRRALKGALGQQAIPSARKTTAPPASGKSTVTQPAAQVAPPQPSATPAPPPAAASETQSLPAASGALPTISPVQSRGPQAPTPATQSSFAPPGSENKSIGGILGATGAPQAPAADQGATAYGDKAASGSPADPYANLDFGDFTDFTQSEQPRPEPKSAPTARIIPDRDPAATWDNLDPVQVQPSQSLNTNSGSMVTPLLEPTTSQATAAPVESPVALAPVDGGKVAAAVKAPPTPAQAAQPATSASPWGNLDAIAAPANVPARGGLGGAMLSKARASSSKGLFHREEKAKPEQSQEFVEGPPIEMDEVAAKAKLNQIMSSTDERSDYVFGTPGLDMRMLGRIDGWVHEIEQKDAFEHGHAVQTAKYASAIAQEAGLSQERVDVIRQAALVHDVGKLGSPATLLQKPDEKLEDPELLAVMRHPIAGAELLESFPDLKHLTQIVLTHREEFNGEGYPQGLKGEEIPVEARVIAVANGYHCLVSPMKYGPGLEASAAQQRLVEEAGKKYDPTFVQALVQAIMTRRVPATF